MDPSKGKVSTRVTEKARLRKAEEKLTFRVRALASCNWDIDEKNTKLWVSFPLSSAGMRTSSQELWGKDGDPACTKGGELRRSEGRPWGREPVPQRLSRPVPTEGKRGWQQDHWTRQGLLAQVQAQWAQNLWGKTPTAKIRNKMTELPEASEIPGSNPSSIASFCLTASLSMTNSESIPLSQFTKYESYSAIQRVEQKTHWGDGMLITDDQLLKQQWNYSKNIDWMNGGRNPFMLKS